MSNRLIKIQAHNNKVVCDNPQDWHFSLKESKEDPEEILCSGEVLKVELGADFEVKIIKLGGIQCDKCMQKIRRLKNIKL